MKTKVIELLSQYPKVLIIGPYPPPLGGVSVHLYRLHKNLSNSKIYNMLQKHSKMKIYYNLIKDILTSKYYAIHLHSITIKLLLILYLLRYIKKYEIIVTDHNARLFDAYSNFNMKILKFLLEKIDVLVVVGEHILDSYSQKKIKVPSNIIIESSFLAPPEDEEKKILDTYPKELEEFLISKKPLLSGNAYQLVFHNNVDLYGLDMCLELVKNLKYVYPNIGFVFALANENVNSDYFKLIQESILEYDLNDNIFFLTGQRELWPLFKKIDLMVRPTVTDGFGISIAEALYFGCPAIASNVCKRAAGTILFENRDLNDFIEKCKKSLQDKYENA